MPEAIAPPSTPAAPANGTPAPTPTPAVAAPAVDVKAELERIEAGRRDIERKERAHVQTLRKHAEEKKTLGEKLSRLAELEKREQSAKLNPVAFLKSIYGDGWYDIATKAKLDGIPPADLVASELEKVKEEFHKELSTRDEQAAQARAESARQALAADAHAFVAASGKEYPVFEGYQPEAIAKLLAQRVESEYNLAYKRNEATGAPTTPISIKAAADLVESELVAIAERVAASEKYRAKLAEKFKPSAPAPAAPAAAKPQRPEPQQRHTLSNDLTGTTPSKTAPLSDAERLERAITARDAARKRPTS